MHLAKRIVQNKQYTTYEEADDEYDFDKAPRKKQNEKGKSALEQKLTENTSFQPQLNLITPKHLVLSIANFKDIVAFCQCRKIGHYKGLNRNFDDDAWNEICKFRKCLVRMFAEQENNVIFIGTAMGLSQQHRHCMVECIPIPYTSMKGLCHSIPKDFCVEFGLEKGFLQVIDGEKQLETNIGLILIRGMHEFPVEDMYRRRQHESVEAQKQAASRFALKWQPFDWTRLL
ncbi:hypothetical protein AMTRI_Chr08g208500 [Amborella trichopoda]